MLLFDTLKGCATVLCMFATAATPTPTAQANVEQPIINQITLTDFDKQQIECMAINAYFEARAEPRKGIIAVNNVVLNRVEDSRFPDTPCEVVYQKGRSVCQFSWYCDGRSDYPRDRDLYAELRELAEDSYLGELEDVTHGAKFYHANYVRPRWAYRMEKTIRIGAHIFYRG